MAENQPANAGSGGGGSAGNKAGILAKAQKRFSRTKTKVLQNLGKAEKTTDEVFTENVQRIERQQEVGHHLQKEIKCYMHCLRDLSQASKSLHTVLADTYEPEWTDEGTFKSQLQAFELLWNDYVQTLQDKVVAPMQTYLQSFPALKNKVAKRGRKLVDFDNSRHHLEVLQAAKKKDEVKIQKAQEELKEAKRIYEEMNEELHTELPDFYNGRVTFYASLFNSLFNSEYVFHSESGKIHGNLGDISDRLAKDYEQFAYRPKRLLSSSAENGLNGEPSSPPSSPNTSLVGTPLSSAAVSPKDGAHRTYVNQDSSEKRKSDGPDVKQTSVNGDGSPGEEDDEEEEEEEEEKKSPSASQREETGGKEKEEEEEQKEEKEEESGPLSVQQNNLYEEPRESAPAPVTPVVPATKDSDDEDVNENKDDESDEDANLYSHPPSNKPVDAPPEGTLYTVQATHKYSGEDVDELDFEPGEIIYVITFENPDEQDDGWQMGIKKSDGVKGVFPENFTQKL